MLIREREQLTRGAAEWGIGLDETALDRFARFAQLLEQTNRTLNLTRVPPQEYVTRHFLDSLALAAVWKPQPGDRLIDVGTGAGFPGVPLALAFPELSVTLLDSTGKKLAFLDSVLAELGVANAKTRHGRAEEIALLPAHRGKYAVATARAVAPLDKLAGWLLPFVQPGGLAVAYKSATANYEIEAARPALAALGAALQTVEVALPETDITRVEVDIEVQRLLMQVRTVDLPGEVAGEEHAGHDGDVRPHVVAGRRVAAGDRDGTGWRSCRDVSYQDQGNRTRSPPAFHHPILWASSNRRRPNDPLPDAGGTQPGRIEREYLNAAWLRPIPPRSVTRRGRSLLR